VVANESMGSGCVLVASDEIGSIPYMVEDGKNGCTFKSSSRLKGFSRFGVSVDNRSLKSIEAKVEWLINHPEERRCISINAIATIRDVWNPTVAAKNLLKLIDSIQQGKDNPILFGPCSNA
jgi:glycosyltransferase involved in cell wall biosynthesis